MVEAMVALTLVDHLMMQQAQCELFANTDGIEKRPNPLGRNPVRVHVGQPIFVAPKTATDRPPISQRVDEE